MGNRVLHLLSQRPSFTGSGVSLDATVRLADAAGWEQQVVIGTPHDDPNPPTGGLDESLVRPLRFGDGELGFPLPGMSDVMPYPSSRFAGLDERQLADYRGAWRRHVSEAVTDFKPDVIHTRHIWLLSALVKDVAPDVPVVNHCHATGLRQMALCPHLADEVRYGCARNDRFCVLHQGHADHLTAKLKVAPGRVHTVGTGYRKEIFHARGVRNRNRMSIAYAGKYSNAKGLPWLLDAVERLGAREPGLVLHVAGDGAGREAEDLRARMAAMAPRVVMHGQLGQKALAELMRSCSVFVLPSFYEGLPLVLIEALACGCRLVCTDLPGLRHSFGSNLDRVLDRVSLPRLIGPDVPVPEDLPAFVTALEDRIEAVLRMPPLGDPAKTMPDVLRPFTWDAVFARIERIWLEVIDAR